VNSGHPSGRGALRLAMRWPNVAGLKWSESAFVGAFHPSRALHVDVIERPATAGLSIETGDGWFLAAT